MNSEKAGSAVSPLSCQVQGQPQSRAALSRTLPFAVFMAFIGVEEGLRFLSRQEVLALQPAALYYLYPLKTVTVAALLYLFKGAYTELHWRELAKGSVSAVSWAVGIGTCIMWVLCDWTIPVTGTPAGFDPALLPSGPVRIAMTGVRIAGAVLVVPLMEELFWRSFLLRYLIRSDFESAELGQFTWSSFLIAALLFGLEHHFFFAGVAAGAIYSLVLYKTRSLAHCVLAHAVTNLSLACYVLYTGKWYFW